MKRFFVAALFALCALSAHAFDAASLDFSIKPKTAFTAQPLGASTRRGGFVAPHGTARQNARDVPLPSKKLLRGFERFPKVDAFGDALPDSFLLYRQNLSGAQKTAYDEIYKAVMNAAPALPLLSRVSKRELGAVIEAVYYDNPECFWWAGDCGWYYNADGTVTEVRFTYLFSDAELAQKSKLFLNLSLPIIFYANLLESDMDKIKYVHDYLCLSVDYDQAAFDAGDYGGKLQSAYSAVVEYKSVCAGYSRAFAYYMQQLGIPCTVVHGDGHAWNLLCADGEFCQMDVTWNDGSYIPPYFNLPHSAMQRVESHTPSPASRAVIAAHPSHSERAMYEAYFGALPTGLPYTYQEFSNLAADIEAPAYARVYTANTGAE